MLGEEVGLINGATDEQLLVEGGLASIYVKLFIFLPFRI